MPTDPSNLPPIPRNYQPRASDARKRNPETISRERVRQIEKMALRKLKRELILRGYKLGDLLPD